jgi:hypothetical protein
MAHPIATTVTITAGNASLIAASQSLALAGTLTLTGSPVTLDAPRRVVVHSNGNDSAVAFVVTGTARNEQGNIVQSETITGGNGADVATTQDFLTVSSIAATGATASTVTAGTNGTASGPWVVWDQYAQPAFAVGCQGNVLSGAPTWNVEYTQDDPFLTWLPPNVPFPRATIVPEVSLFAQTTDSYGTLTGPIRASRLTLTAYGSVQLTQIQPEGH